jgi:hypothetical protein
VYIIDGVYTNRKELLQIFGK